MNIPTPKAPCPCGSTIFHLATNVSTAGRLVAVGFDVSSGCIVARWRCDRCNGATVVPPLDPAPKSMEDA